MTDEVLFSKAGCVGRLLLNRPAVLNALTLEMFQTIAAVLREWQYDSEVSVVVIRGAGRAFCAGGDIRTVRQAALSGNYEHNDTLYREEYRLNALIHNYPKPYIAVIDGICMGGGLGVAAHGTYRLVTERAVLAMPEATLGFFPDIGSSYLLPRLPGALGIYVGLTGTRLTAADALYCGLGTHQIRDEHLPRIEDYVGPQSDASSIGRILDAIGVPPSPSRLEVNRNAIDRCFSAPTVQDIISSLQREQTQWSQLAIAALRRASPTSLYVTLELLHKGRSLDLASCLEMEYQLARRFSRSREFHEGVRAVIVDKDQSPAWQPSRVEDVDVAAIDAIMNEIDVSLDTL